MHAALAYLSSPSTTFDLPCAGPIPAPAPARTPHGTFVNNLVDSLDWTFGLDASDAELARQLLFGRKLGVIARMLGVSVAEAQAMCRELFRRTGTDGRQQLFELGLRLTATRELSNHFVARA